LRGNCKFALPRNRTTLWQARRIERITDFDIHYSSIHNLGLVGHIEDIAVAKDQQGKKLGLRIIQALDFVAENVGCYKTILDCSEANEGFYVKCGFKRAGLEMAHYYEKK
jgi:GNAT superfamily N-acetyltransferase